MLSNQDNELMCRVGPGTAMGAAMRQTWVPALMSSEVAQPNGDPVHVQLLGESFVAFRNSEGKVGLLDEMCCHRGASLTIGRVENCGIRCIYHGWLFAPDGTLLETPNVADPRFKDRFKAKSYPVREAGGLVWVYLGAVDKMPPLPNYSFMDFPAENRLNLMAVSGCNYVQVLEGLLDSAHLSILHTSMLKGATDSHLQFAKVTQHMQFDAAPRVECEETEFGLHYAAMRTVGGRQETRVTAFVSPFVILNANGDLTMLAVPMTDEKTAFYHVWHDSTRKYGAEPLKTDQACMVGLDQATLEKYGMTRGTADGPNRMNRSNRWGQNRLAIKAGHFTGMDSFTQEDAVVCVSGGGIRPRDKEILSTSDMAISQMYRTLLKTARKAQGGGVAIGVGVSFASVGGTHAALELGEDWRRLVPAHYQPLAHVAASA